MNPTAIQLLESLGTCGKYDHPFIGRRGRPLTTIHKVWTRLRADAGLSHLRIHDLRHQYASFLINQGRTLYEVMQVLGHSDPSVTIRAEWLLVDHVRRRYCGGATENRPGSVDHYCVCCQQSE